jgi:hypothetical protein
MRGAGFAAWADVGIDAKAIKTRAAAEKECEKRDGKLIIIFPQSLRM